MSEDTQAIYERWAQLATRDPEIQKKIQSRLQSVKQLNEETKKPKKNCSVGNPYHGPRGKFTNIGRRGSWSVPNPDNKDNCDHGKMRTTGSGKGQQWTKQPCGRDDDGKGKAKYKCKDGTLAELDLLLDVLELKDVELRLKDVLNEDPDFVSRLSYLVQPIIRAESDKNVEDRDLPNENPEEVKELKRQTAGSIQRACASRGYISFGSFLRRLNAIEKSKRGNLHKPDVKPTKK